MVEEHLREEAGGGGGGGKTGCDLVRGCWMLRPEASAGM